MGLDPGSTVIYIPCRAIGHVLGIGGAGIKEIVNETHARVRIANLAEMDMGSTEVRTIITGPSVEAVEAAKTMVLQKLGEWFQEKVFLELVVAVCDCGGLTVVRICFVGSASRSW